MTDTHPYAVLKLHDFRMFLLARVCLTGGWTMQGLIVSWQVYNYTHDPFSLGLVGLAEVIPFIATSFYGGYMADRHNRKKLTILFTLLYFSSALALLLLTLPFIHLLDQGHVLPIYLIIGVTGIARGFVAPAINALLSQTVPRESLSNAVAWNSNVWHSAAVAGPAVGGLIYGFIGITWAYAVVAMLMFASLIFFSLIKGKVIVADSGKESLAESLTAGSRFVFGNPILLSTLSLDMFIVLFGGVTAMLPVFAKDILHVGPEGLGLMRAAPFLGSITMGLVLAHRPPMQYAGKNLLWSMAGFGLTIIGFALSHNFYLSLALLFVNGLFDNVSVIIRGTVLQLIAPEHMRGRVSAFNSVFVGSSNELGAFESGLTAKLMGLLPSVYFGGVVTLLITAGTAWLAPTLRNLNLRKIQEEMSHVTPP